MDANKTETPELDSWDQQDDPGPGDPSQTEEIDDQFSRLNVNAKPFVPNVNAAEFVPSFGNFKPSEASNCSEMGKEIKFYSEYESNCLYEVIKPYFYGP